MQVVILCGGMGTRLRELTENIPKPLVEIGGRPILWHIMKLYSSFGFHEFILCLGYKGEAIKQYFVDYKSWKNHDFTLNFADLADHEHGFEAHGIDDDEKKWKITFVNTGLETNTGGRIKRVEKFISGQTFLVTYGDGLADMNLHELISFHKEKNKIATMTCPKLRSQFGIVEINEHQLITNFKEKPFLDQWFNGGFFVFDKRIFSYLSDDCVLEKEPFEKLAKEGELAAYKLDGFWKSMDTFKDAQDLNMLWKSEEVPWKKK